MKQYLWDFATAIFEILWFILKLFLMFITVALVVIAVPPWIIFTVMVIIALCAYGHNIAKEKKAQRESVDIKIQEFRAAIAKEQDKIIQYVNKIAEVDEEDIPIYEKKIKLSTEIVERYRKRITDLEIERTLI